MTQWLLEHWQGIVTFLAAYFAFRAWVEAMVEKRREIEDSIQSYFHMNLPLDLRRHYRGRKLDVYLGGIVVKDVRKIKYKLSRILLGFSNKFVTYAELAISKKGFNNFTENEINRLQSIYDHLVKELNSVNNFKINYLGSYVVEYLFIIKIQVSLTDPNKLDEIFDSIGKYFDERF